MIKMIVAVDTGNAIGWSDGALAYRGLKSDMARFKALTSNSTVVMGRSTYLSLGRPNGLPNRRNIVLTRRPYSEFREQIKGDVEIISSLDWVVQHNAAAIRTVAGTDREPSDVWLIGGASVYDEALAKGIVDEIHMTLVHASCEADVRLKTDIAAWKLFVIRERVRGVLWEPEIGSTEWDGDFQTTYIVLRKTT
jgi:dihydrofolate reductase